MKSLITSFLLLVCFPIYAQVVFHTIEVGRNGDIFNRIHQNTYFTIDSVDTIYEKITISFKDKNEKKPILCYLLKYNEMKNSNLYIFDAFPYENDKIVNTPTNRKIFINTKEGVIYLRIFKESGEEVFYYRFGL